MLKKAFTLSEVLLVISIIGIVSALTIPALVTSSKDEQVVIKLKQVKNELDLAVQKSFLNYGEFDEWIDNDNEDIANMIMAFIDSKRTSHFPLSTYKNNSSYYKYAAKKGSTYFAINASSSPIKVIVAVGGYSDNTLGKDIFGFDIDLYEGTVHPFGYNSDVVGLSNALSVSNNINATNWAINVGNLDYLKCKNSLNWQNQTSCN